jgi:hypothetical protein
MKTKLGKSTFLKLLLVAFLVFGGLLVPRSALAHETVTVGDYAVEYGWVSEPAVVGQPNAVVVNLSLNTAPAGSAPQEVDASGLTVQVVFGGQNKMLALQPLGEDTPGQFIAPITPMRPGIYTIHFGGAIGSTTFNTDVQPEEVQTADVVQFPAADSAQSSAAATGGSNWLGIAGIVLGAFGTVLGVIALTRKPAGK